MGSDSTLPEDYFMSINCSSGYGSTIINETINDEGEEFAQHQRDKEQETEVEHLPEHIPQEHTLKE